MQDPSPGFLARAANAFKAAARHVANRGRKVDAAETSRRLAICQSCPIRHPAKMVCRHPDCGCNLNIKATWESEHCPVSKW